MNGVSRMPGCMFVKKLLLAASLLYSERKRLMLRNIRLDHLSVCLAIHKVYCGKTADWIRMPFGVVSGVDREIGVLNGGCDSRREGAVLGVNLGCPVVTNKAFATRLFSNYFEDLFTVC